MIGPAHFKLSWLYAAMGRYREAVSELQKYDGTAGSWSGDARGYNQLTLALAAHNPNEWKTSTAMSFAQAGDREKAFEYLRKAADEGEIELILGIRYPALDALRSDPRFTELMRQMGLPE
jgi:tetratricopeptide (TPR) repeat protein